MMTILNWVLVICFSTGGIDGGIHSTKIEGFSENGCREAVKVVKYAGERAICVEVK